MIALIVLIVALVLAVAVLAVLVLARAGARREPDRWLPVQPRGPLARLARRVLGLHVRKPSHIPEQRRSEPVGAGERR